MNPEVEDLGQPGTEGTEGSAGGIGGTGGTGGTGGRGARGEEGKQGEEGEQGRQGLRGEVGAGGGLEVIRIVKVLILATVVLYVFAALAILGGGWWLLRSGDRDAERARQGRAANCQGQNEVRAQLREDKGLRLLEVRAFIRSGGLAPSVEAILRKEARRLPAEIEMLLPIRCK